jgi:hypothetical protein
MTYPKTVFDIREFGENVLMGGNDGPALQAMINEAENLEGSSYSTVAEIQIPVGFTANIDQTIVFSKRPLKVRFDSMLFYHGQSTALAWNPSAPPVNPGHWDVDMAGIFKVGAGACPGFPSYVDYNGSCGIIIRNMVNSFFRVKQLQGFTYAGVELDGRGMSYGQPSGGGQVIQHNDFHFGQTANCGYGIRALSAHAATSSVQGNRIKALNVYQCAVSYSDGDPNFRASTSNTIEFDSADNASHMVFELWCSHNKVYSGFTGAPGTSLVFRPGSYNNRVECTNGPSTNFVVSDQSGPGSGNVVIMPS